MTDIRKNLLARRDDAQRHLDNYDAAAASLGGAVPTTEPAKPAAKRVAKTAALAGEKTDRWERAAATRRANAAKKAAGEPVQPSKRDFKAENERAKARRAEKAAGAQATEAAPQTAVDPLA